MSFRYVNPGYVYLLDSDVTATQITGNTYSKTGVAFTQTNSDAGVTIPQFAEGDDFWAKFDVYIPDNVNSNFIFSSPSTYKAGLEASFYPYNSSRICQLYADFRNGAGMKAIVAGQPEVVGIKLGDVNSFAVHVVYGDASTALVEVFANKERYYLDGYSIAYSTSYPPIAKLYATNTDIKFSSVIFSDTEISPKEQAIALPISATATDMTAGENGMYTATAAGQTLLQTPDITALAQQFSSESKITGIQVVGNPAYKTSTGLETMIGLSKSGTVTTEHGSYTLGTDSTALVMDGWGLSGVTLNDLPNMQFGWKVAD